jgi:hypothetical protein
MRALSDRSADALVRVFLKPHRRRGGIDEASALLF